MVETAGEPMSRALICSISGTLCALPLDGVIEVMRLMPVNVIDHAPSFVRGVSIIRGEPVIVIDGASLLGLPSGDPADRLVVMRVGERLVAFAVTSVVGVRSLSYDLVRDLPPLLQLSELDAVTELGRLDGELLVVLGAAHLLDLEAWEVLAHEATR